MPRSTLFTPEIAARTLDVVRSGGSRKDAARTVGVSRRALGYWTRRGRRGEAPFRKWVAAMDFEADRHRRRRVCETWERNRIKGRERWQKFRESRAAWWEEQLGSMLFRVLRVRWLKERGYEAALQRFLAE